MSGIVPGGQIKRGRNPYPMVRVMVQAQKNSPMSGLNLPFVRGSEPGQTAGEQTSHMFIGHFSIWLEPTWEDDVIRRCHPAVIKAGDG